MLNHAANNQQELTLVTAFFDIDRKSWNGFERSIQNYVDNFTFWARIRNHLVIYTEPAMVTTVFNIRKSFGLENKTTIIPIEDITKLDNEVFLAMKAALANQLTVNFRAEPNNPESHNAMYNFIMYAKAIFLDDAVKRKITNDMVAWIDFGFSHGGDYYIKADEFDFLWTVDIETDKIHTFCIESPDDKPIWEVIRSMKTYFDGSSFIVPANLCNKLLAMWRKASLSMAVCGFSDDDQTVMLMAYRMNSHLFKTYDADGRWFRVIEFTADRKFTIASKKNTIPIKPHKASKTLAKQNWKNNNYISALIYFVLYTFQKIVGK